MAHLSEAELLQVKEQGGFARERCDNPGCRRLIREISWPVGRKIYCQESCAVANGWVIGRRKKRGSDVSTAESKAPSTYNLSSVVSGDVAVLEKEIVRLVTENRKEIWTVGCLFSYMCGSDRKAIRTAVHNLVDRKELGRQGWGLIPPKAKKAASASVSEALENPGKGKGTSGSGKTPQKPSQGQEKRVKSGKTKGSKAQR